MDLHAKIMGLDVPTYSGLIASPDYAARMGYLDARHAAAALALEQQAELEALRKDAERYRWLRRRKVECSPHVDIAEHAAERMDAAIDAAMEG